MVDWVALAFDAVGVFGVALALITASVAGWAARERGTSLRSVLAAKGSIVPLAIGAALSAVSLARGAFSWWQTAFWLIAATALAYSAITGYRRTG